MDGIEAVESIRKHIEVPVVYLTALTDHATFLRSKSTLPYGYSSNRSVILSCIRGGDRHPAASSRTSVEGKRGAFSYACPFYIGLG